MSKLPPAKKSWSLRRKDQRESGEFESVDGERLQRIPDELFNKSVGSESEIMEFEKLLAAAKNDKNAEADPARAVLLKQPEEDVVVRRVAPERKTVKSAVPKLPKKGIKEHIRLCCRFYTSDLVQVDRLHKNLIPLRGNNAKDPRLASLRRSEFLRDEQTNAEDKELADAAPADAKPKPRRRNFAEFEESKRRRLTSVIGVDDPVNSKLIEAHDPKIMDQENLALRRDKRFNLFQLFQGAETYLSESITTLHPPYQETNPRARRILLEPFDLSFQLGTFEPFFCGIALYDLANKKKISETHHFQLNSQEVLDALYDPTIVPAFKFGLFTISNPNPNIYIVLRIEKILQGDIDAVAEPYVKCDGIKPKDLQKVQDLSEDSVRRVPYTQPFAWGTVPLFGEDLELLEVASIKPIFKVKSTELDDESLFAILAEYSKTGTTKRMKSIPAALALRMKELPVDKVPKNTLDPSFNLLRAIDDQDEAPAIPIMEVQEFPSKPRLAPNLSYVNNMYLYLENLNLSNRPGALAARNIAVEVRLLENDLDLNAPGLNVFYGKGRNEFVNKYTSTVTYHSKAPQFYDEIKIALPPNLNADHHLLFIFYHINVQPGKRGQQQQMQQNAGYAVWPILQNDRIITKENLPVAFQLPETEYISNEAAIKYIDSKKPLFQVRTKLVSTIYSQDAPLYNVMKRIKDVKENADARATDLHAKAVLAIPKVHPIRIVQYLPVLLNYIFRVMCSNEASGKKSFEVLHDVLQSVHDETSDAANLFGSYVDNILDLVNVGDKYLHQVICKQYMLAIRDSEKDSEIILKFCWFFLRIIFKSMVLKLASEKQLSPVATRKNRYQDDFVKDLKGLVVILTWEIHQRSRSALTLGKDMTKALANFFCDLFAIMDPGIVFSMIDRYIREISGMEDDLTLVEYKFEFFKTLGDYEHFVFVNLPIQIPVPSSLSDTNSHWRRHHFITSLLLEQVNHYTSHTAKAIQIKSMASIRKLFVSHDFDHRYVSDQTVQQNVSSLYFPLLLIMVDHPVKLDFVFRENRDYLICFLFLLKNVSPSLLAQWWSKETKSRLYNFFEILYTCINTFEFIGRKQWLQKMEEGSEVESSDQTKAMLESFYSEGFGPKRSYRSFREQRNLRQSSMNAFDPNVVANSSPSSSSSSSASSSGSSAIPVPGPSASPAPSPAPSPLAGRFRSESIDITAADLPHDTSSSSSSAGAPKGHPGSGGTLNGSEFRRFKKQGARIPQPAMEFNEVQESQLSVEVNLIILDTLENFLQTFHGSIQSAKKGTEGLTQKIMLLILHFMKSNQSYVFLPHLFNSLRSFVVKFPRTLFGNSNAEALGELCYLILQHCNVEDLTNRSNAGALLFLLMRENYFQMPSTFHRLTVLITIALSKLVGSKMETEVYVRRVLTTLSRLTQLHAVNWKPTPQSPSRSPGNGRSSSSSTLEVLGGSEGEDSKGFVVHVTRLIERLNTILCNSARASKFEGDNEMTIDLIHRIAKGYTNAPSLRVTWLENLADFHVQKKNYAEAAMCHIHIAAMVTQFLVDSGSKVRGVPQEGCKAFAIVSPNSLEELAISEAQSSIATDESVASVDQSTITAEKLILHITLALEELKKADLYEASNLLYKLLLPIYEAKREYEKLLQSHEDLRQIFEEVQRTIKQQSRMLGSYYRVGFYGAKFEDLAGKEFIYKEPKITTLWEIKERLKTLYEDRFGGPSSLEIISSSKPVDVASLDTRLAYIQITSVDPYFDDSDRDERVTYFEQHYNINRFVFETPFTIDGRTQTDDIAEQYKRKTIITVEHFFPYLTTRLPVVSRQEIELTPLLNAIEAINSRIVVIHNETICDDPNLKKLQPLLQGSVRLQVNAGPVAICRTFFEHYEKYPLEQMEELRKGLNGFLEACRQGLKLHESLISHDMLQFHQELMQGYREVKTQMRDAMRAFTLQNKKEKKSKRKHH